MLFLAKLDSWNIPIPDAATMKDTAFEVYQALEAELNPGEADEFRFPDFDCIDINVSFTFGAFDPMKLISTAESWNDDIKESLIKAVEAALYIKGTGSWPPAKESISLDASNWTALYGLTTAANMAADVFDASATKAVCTKNECGWTHLCHVLPQKMCDDIMEHPEDYVLVDIYVKSC